MASYSCRLRARTPRHHPAAAALSGRRWM